MKRKIAVRVLKGTVYLISFLFLLVLLLTLIINREPVQGRIREAVSERAGETLTFEKLRVALFPRPHLVLNNAIVFVPGAISGLVPTAAVYPELKELLKGNVRIASVRLDDPDLVATLSEGSGTEETDDPAAIFTETRGDVEAITDRVRKAAPGFRGEIRRGTLKIVRDGDTLSEMKKVSATVALASRGFSIRLDAETPRWGQISAKGSFLVFRRGFRMNNVTVSGGRSSLSGFSARFSWRKRPYLQVLSGEAAISLEDVYERRAMFGLLKDRLQGVKSMKGTVRFAELSFRGPLLRPERWKLQTAGTFKGVVLTGPLFPGNITVEDGRFTATAKSLALTGLRGSFLDSTLTASATLSGSVGRVQSLDLRLQGIARSKTMHWTQNRFGPSPWLALRTPLTLANLRIRWVKGRLFSLSGRGGVRSGPAFSIDFNRRPGELIINRLTIKDGTSDAAITLTNSKQVLEVKFKGTLEQSTLAKIFDPLPVQYGWIRGDAQMRMRFDRPQASTASGRIEASDFTLPSRLPVSVRQLNLEANRRVLTVKSANFDWAGIPVDLKGEVVASDDGFILDLDAGTGSVDVEKVRQLLRPENAEKTDAGNGKTVEPIKAVGRVPLRGVVRFYATDFVFGGYVMKPFRADAFFMPDTIRLKLLTATVCGVSVGGTIQPFGAEVQFDLVPIAVPQPLEPALQCFGQRTRITGNFEMHSTLKAKAPAGKLMPALNGQIDFSASGGKIYRYPLLSRIFAFLNVTELLRGKVPDMGRDGFAYKKIRIRGEILGGKLRLQEASLEGTTLNLAAEGEINLAANTINVVVLVAPFKTIEYILSKIPLVRNILANRLVTVPIRVKGSLNDPEVDPLHPDAIGKNLLDIMRRTLELPFKVFD